MGVFKFEEVKLSDLHLNKGQIPGVPKNPRFIKDERFEALKKSLKDDPEMLELREIVAYDNNGELVVIMGNMRFRALKEINITDKQVVKILPVDTPSSKLRAYISKDNIAFGQNDWDCYANEWDLEELQDFGLECDFLTPVDEEANIDDLFEEEPCSSKEKDIKIEVILPLSMSEHKDELNDLIKETLSSTELFKELKVKTV